MELRPYLANTLAGLKLAAIAFPAIAGEGPVARDLKARGHHVVAIDRSPTLLRYAKEADPDSRDELADAAALPFAGGSFDLVVAYNALIDIADMRAAVGEAARVLEPGGQFCVCVTCARRLCPSAPRRGFVIASLREPVPTDEALRQQPSFERRRRIPLFLQLRAAKR